MMSEKDALRRRFKEWREQLSPPEHTALSAALCQQVELLPAFQEPTWLLGFSPLAGEPDIRPLLQAALLNGRRVALPRCVRDTRELRFYEITSWDELTSGSYGIAEPPENPARLWQPTADALCIVPALSYDRQGYRLGYGGGYYDRFLPAFSGITLGLCPQACLQAELPRDAYDQPISVVVTEHELYDRRDRHDR